MPRKLVGVIDQRVVDLLGLSVSPGTPIYLGESNIAHMKSEHPDDYSQYSGQLEEIVGSPDYVALHPGNGSIQYIKVLDEHVMVAVQVTAGGTWYARTLFHMSPEKVSRYKANPDILKKY